ncbi:MAG: TolC family protein [Mariprofundus sp.]
MKKLIGLMITAIALFAVAQPATASDNMSLKQVIQAVLSNQPDLAISRIDSAIAATETQRIEGILDPIVSASILASEEQTPVSSAFQASETRIGQLTGGISKPLSNGGTVSAGFVYNRISQGFSSPFAAQLASFNPAFRNQINVSYRHPLFKGAGRPDYHHALTAADAGMQSSAMQQQVIARQFTLQAINAYYQLAADEINTRIAGQAVKRAKKLLAYQRSREQFGLIEKADRLQAEALLAARKTDLQRAVSRRLTDLNSINRLMLRSADAPLTLEQPLTDDIPTPSIAEAFAVAESNRPELQVLKAQLEASQAQLAINRDADDIQLDLVAEAGTRSLDSNAATAAARGFSPNDHYVSLSVEFSDVLSRNSARASIRKAELQYQRILAQRNSAMEQIKTDLSTAITAINGGKPVLAVARKQAAAEKQKFKAEMKRYRAGRSDTATLVQFEGELRNAELNAELQALTVQLTIRQLAWAQNTLLAELDLSDSKTGEAQ